LTGRPDTSWSGEAPVRAAVSDDVVVGDGRLALLAGPCVVESRDLVLEIAGTLKAACERLGVPFVFKASLDKANRTSAGSFRGMGFDAALELLAEVKRTFGVPVVTDIHEPWHAAAVADVVDLLQIPAFLCRQTDLLVAAGATGRAVNVKKGQFMAAEDMAYAVDKVRAGGSDNVLLTERGTTFGYHDLVVDFRGLAIMRRSAPVVFDATHSVQSPGGGGGKSSGKREFVSPLARAAVAFGVDALFLETHPEPDKALSDGPNMLPLAQIEGLLEDVLAIRHAQAGGVPS
jgi:2-dehydro-3-deoxyphosphooctonate aldolase (KDO 8-P synthase)